MSRALAPVRVHDTLSRELREVTPGMDGILRFYACGPTIHDLPHVGNARLFTWQDLFKRVLRARGYEVLDVMNVTDIEDKIIERSRAAGIDVTDPSRLPEFTARFESAFLDDLKALRVLRPAFMPRATEFVPRMLELVQRLVERGHAYESDGSVYFSVASLPGYGKLSHLEARETVAGARVAADEYDKDDVRDFVLWKASKPGEPRWTSPWGDGRPGWHIECSAMAMDCLGSETIDVHVGGEDLVFPHHEDEIAQSEAATGKPFVRCWLHSAHLLVDGRKMSKSEGNFFTLRDLLAKGFTGRELRYALVSVHYRLPLNFTLENLEAARQTLRRLDAWAERLREKAGGATADASKPGSLAAAFSGALDADLNISDALGNLFEALRESNRRMDGNELGAKDAAELWRDWKAVERVLGLPASDPAGAPPEIAALAEERKAARQAKNWKRSDELRDTIHAKGWSVKDSPEGYKLTKL